MNGRAPPGNLLPRRAPNNPEAAASPGPPPDPPETPTPANEKRTGCGHRFDVVAAAGAAEKQQPPCFVEAAAGQLRPPRLLVAAFVSSAVRPHAQPRPAAGRSPNLNRLPAASHHRIPRSGQAHARRPNPLVDLRRQRQTTVSRPGPEEDTHAELTDKSSPSPPNWSPLLSHQRVEPSRTGSPCRNEPRLVRRSFDAGLGQDRAELADGGEAVGIPAGNADPAIVVAEGDQPVALGETARDFERPYGLVLASEALFGGEAGGGAAAVGEEEAEADPRGSCLCSVRFAERDADETGDLQVGLAGQTCVILARGPLRMRGGRSRQATAASSGNADFTENPFTRRRLGHLPRLNSGACSEPIVIPSSCGLYRAGPCDMADKTIPASPSAEDYATSAANCRTRRVFCADRSLRAVRRVAGGRQEERAERPQRHGARDRR